MAEDAARGSARASEKQCGEAEAGQGQWCPQEPTETGLALPLNTWACLQADFSQTEAPCTPFSFCVKVRPQRCDGSVGIAGWAHKASRFSSHGRAEQAFI